VPAAARPRSCATVRRTWAPIFSSRSRMSGIALLAIFLPAGPGAARLHYAVGERGEVQPIWLERIQLVESDPRTTPVAFL